MFATAGLLTRSKHVLHATTQSVHSYSSVISSSTHVHQSDQGAADADGALGFEGAETSGPGPGATETFGGAGAEAEGSGSTEIGATGVGDIGGGAGAEIGVGACVATVFGDTGTGTTGSVDAAGAVSPKLVD